MIKATLVALAVLATAQTAFAEGKPAGTCAKSAYLLALDAIDRPDAKVDAVAPTGVREMMEGTVQQGLSKLILDRLPDRIYEKNATWKEIVITKWDCIEDLTAHWKARGAAAVKSPSTDGARLFSVGVFEDAPPSTATPADLVPPGCNAPIYLLGVNTVTDPEKYALYTRALGASKLTARHGFRRIIAGTPKPELAGRWPPNTTVTLSTWPCIEAFEKFHFSDAYHKDLMPMRLASSRYRLVAFLP